MSTPQVPHPATGLLSFDDTEGAFAYKSTEALQRARTLFRSIGVPMLAKLGPRLLNTALRLHLPVRGLARRYFFDQFCGGYDLNEARKTAHMLAKYGVHSTLDFAVEAQKSKEGYEKCLQEIFAALQLATEQEAIPFVAIKLTGLGNLHALAAAQTGALTQPDAREINDLADRLNRICQKAQELNQPILIDAEESWIQGIIDKMAEDMMLAYNTQKPIVYTTLQMYRHDRLAYLHHLDEKFAQHKAILGVKLVRGAYLEKENDRAREKGSPTPMQPNKVATDRDYDLAVTYMLERHSYMALYAGTHNERSCHHIVTEMQRLNIAHDHPHVYFSQLYGMSDNITFNLARQGYRVSKYLPYGPLEETMPYLFRRAEENTSIAGQSSRELTLIDKELKRRKGRR